MDLFFGAAEQSTQGADDQFCEQDDDHDEDHSENSRYVRMSRCQPGETDGYDIFSETEADV